MHENKFEKQVQEKLDGLNFQAPLHVWTNVDKALNSRKKRRSFFWLFVIGMPMLVTGGYFYYNFDSSQSNSDKPVHDLTLIQRKSADSLTHSWKSSESLAKGDGKGDSHGNRSLGSRLAVLVKKLRVNIEAEKKYSRDSKKLNGGGFSVAHRKATSAESGEDTKPESAENAGENNGVNKTENIVEKKPSDAAGILPGSLPAVSALTEKLPDSAAGKKNTVANTINKDTNSTAKPAVTKIKPVKAWQWGFTATAGISHANKNLFGDKTLRDANAAAISTGGNNSGALTDSASEIHSGFSYSAGAFVNRTLSKRIYISAGLNYHYYSTKISFSQVPSGLQYFTGNNYSANNPNQIAGAQTYTNQFHFIELPVEVGFQLNQSKQRPIIWQAGFGISYMLSTNALLHDDISNSYYRKIDMFNRLQWSTQTALMLGLPVGRNQLQLGPEIQYGLSGLLKNSQLGQDHLLSYGIKFSFIPGKK